MRKFRVLFWIVDGYWMFMVWETGQNSAEKSGNRSPGKGGVASAFRYHGCRYRAGTAAPWSSTGVVKISF